MKRLMLLAALVAAPIGFAAGEAHAFCGFYVAGSNQQMFNDATQVVLMRKGTRTVLSMQNNYKGPVEAFAMVIPVPVVLHEGDVKTLPKDVFDHTDALGSPRLVEYWEQDPCPANYGVEGGVVGGEVVGITGSAPTIDPTSTQSGITQTAFAFERPVVVTAVGGLPDVVDDGVTGYVVPPDDPGALARAIERFFATGASESMSAAIRAQAHRFSWKGCVDALLALAGLRA
jgi:hypothetical protein